MLGTGFRLFDLQRIRASAGPRPLKPTPSAIIITVGLSDFYHLTVFQVIVQRLFKVVHHFLEVFFAECLF
jgi:hypothetical protein